LWWDHDVPNGNPNTFGLGDTWLAEAQFGGDGRCRQLPDRRSWRPDRVELDVPMADQASYSEWLRRSAILLTSGVTQTISKPRWPVLPVVVIGAVPTPDRGPARRRWTHEA